MTVYLTEEQERNLAWVADVLENGGPGYATQANLSRKELDDLAGVVRDALPKPKPAKRLARAVEDKYGTRFERFAGGWYLIEYNPEENVFDALRVPFKSIQEPRFLEWDAYRAYRVVE